MCQALEITKTEFQATGRAVIESVIIIRSSKHSHISMSNK